MDLTFDPTDPRGGQYSDEDVEEIGYGQRTGGRNSARGGFGGSG
jgi:hypothetical protein